jgi:hypothetical protein
VQLAEGNITSYRFQNGTSALRPKLDHRYELTLDNQAFAFTVQNGLRNAEGTAYGNGALYMIEYQGQRFEYHLPGLGWDTVITSIADIDLDGKPDFFISIPSSDGHSEVLLLSSQGKAGRNTPTATLSSIRDSGGC